MTVGMSRGRWLAVLACAALVAVGTGGVAAASGATTSSWLGRSKVAGCRTADLRLSVVPDTATRHHGGGMNHQGATIALVNAGKGQCRVQGYPGAAMTGRGGVVIAPGRVVRGATTYAADPGPHPILLAPGRAAYAELGWASADGKLPAVAVSGLLVTPPDQRTALRVPLATVLGSDRTLRATAFTAAPVRLPA